MNFIRSRELEKGDFNGRHVRHVRNRIVEICNIIVKIREVQQNKEKKESRKIVQKVKGRSAVHRLHCGVRPVRQWNEFAYSNCLSTALHVLVLCGTTYLQLPLQSLLRILLSFHLRSSFSNLPFCIRCLASCPFILFTTLHFVKIPFTLSK